MIGRIPLRRIFGALRRAIAGAEKAHGQQKTEKVFHRIHRSGNYSGDTWNIFRGVISEPLLKVRPSNRSTSAWEGGGVVKSGRLIAPRRPLHARGADGFSKNTESPRHSLALAIP